MKYLAQLFKTEDQKKIIVLATVFSVLSLIILADRYIDKYDPVVVTITATGESNAVAKSSEVWLRNINVNNKNYDLKNNADDKSGWVLKDGVLCSYENQPNTIRFTFKNAKTADLDFGMHQWSGIITISYNDITEKVDLFSDRSDNDTYHYKIKGTEIIYNSIGKKLFYYGVYESILFLLYYAIFIIAFRYKVILLPYSFLCLNVYMIIEQVAINGLQKAAVIMAILSAVFLCAYLNHSVMKKYYRLKNICSVCMLSFYAAFAFIGDTLFLKIQYVDFNFLNMSMLLIFTVWLVPFFLSILCFIDIIKARPFMKNFVCRPEKSIKFFFVVFAIITVVWSIYLYAYRPGILTNDSVDQWGQALGELPLKNHSPVFHTLLIRSLIYVENDPAFVIFVQAVFGAAIAAAFIVFLHKTGIKKSYLILFALIFSMFPTNAINVITLWKDIPYSFSLLWLTFMLADSVELFNKRIHLFQLFLCIVCVSLFRHNGLLVAILSAAFLLWHSRGILRKKIGVAVLISFMTIFVITGPVYKYLDVQPMDSWVRNILMHNDIEGVIYASGEIAPETEVFFTNIMPLEKHREMYSPYISNSYIYGPGLEYKAYVKIGQATLIDYLTMYIDTAVKNPLLMLQSRLLGTEVLWNVFPDNRSYYGFSDGVIANMYGIHTEPNVLHDFIANYVNNISKSSILIALFMKTGVYVILLLLLLLNVYSNGGSTLVFVPILTNIFSLFLSMPAQDYRYVWPIFLVDGFILLYALTLKQPVDFGEEKNKVE